MANLIIDIGNTRTKVAVFENGMLLKVDSYESITGEQLDSYLKKELITHSILASVRSDAAVVGQLENTLRKHTSYIRFSLESATTIKNFYKTPQTLGLDRLAGLLGAQALYPQTNCLVIDAGTCIKYDLINHTGSYFGGSISPGISMRFKALHEFTGKLPLVNFDAKFATKEGTDTISSILSGVIQGALFEMKGFIESYYNRYDQLHVILCGGDALFFDTQLKNGIFAHLLYVEPHLVLFGLNETIQQQND